MNNNHPAPLPPLSPADAEYAAVVVTRSEQAVPTLQEPIIDQLCRAHAEIARLRAELTVTDALLRERQRVLEAIPECPMHGLCVPHALEWVAQTQAENVRLRSMIAVRIYAR